MVRFTWLYLLFLTGGMIAQQKKQVIETGLEFKQQLGIGIHLGGHRAALEIHPRESFSDPVGDPQLLVGGIAVKYTALGLFFARVSADAGFTLLGGSGNFDSTNTAEKYKVTMMQLPMMGGLSFSVINQNRIYFGMGATYILGQVDFTGDSNSSSYALNDFAMGFIVGTEVLLFNDLFLTLEWLHTTGVTSSLGSAGTRDREIGLQSNQILLGLSYYFLK